MKIDLENLDLMKISLIVIGLIVVSGIVAIQSENSSDRQEMEFNRNDLAFMNMMIVHHDQAIEMAELSENRTSNEKILELSNNISEAQTRENEQMTEWMNDLGYSAGNHHRMAGMASEQEMQQLRNSNGSEFNELFSKLMIEHHRGGIAMAENFYESGRNTELREMQGQMIETQTEEIRKMQKWQEQDQL